MRPILSGLGIILHVPGLMALVSIPICLFFSETNGIPGLFVTTAASFAIGQALYWFFRSEVELQHGQAMLLAVFAWILVPILATWPYLLTAWQTTSGNPNFAEGSGFGVFSTALFESVSGFTVTGLSVAAKPSLLPHHLQWWRSLSEWVGGIGIIVLLLSVLPVNRSAMHLFFSEGSKDKILPSVKSTVRAIGVIYFIYTLIAVGLLWLGGEPAWIAINHGMTGIATGGFTITDNSLADTSIALQFTYLLIMVTGAISFAVHYQALHERQPLQSLFGRVEQKLFWSLLIGGALLVATQARVFSGEWSWMASIMQWGSALTTTGFNTVAVADWSPASTFILMFGMLIGANAGSTGGGIKQIRFAVLIHDVTWTLRTFRGRPYEITRIKFNNERLPPTEMAERVRAAATLVFPFLLTWLIGTLLLLQFVPAGTSLEHALFESLSAQSNTGLSTDITNPEMPTGAKYVLMVQMVAGRLEILPVLLVLGYLFRETKIW